MIDDCKENWLGQNPHHRVVLPCETVDNEVFAVWVEAAASMYTITREKLTCKLRTKYINMHIGPMVAPNGDLKVLSRTKSMLALPCQRVPHSLQMIRTSPVFYNFNPNVRRWDGQLFGSQTSSGDCVGRWTCS